MTARRDGTLLFWELIWDGYMTTKVKIDAHCNSETTEVRVKVSGENEQILQDGESAEVHAYDDRVIVIQEVPKGS